ncbi:hypothetical protein D9758_012924 [Tetrapyrgos nigripes]|uniref:Uncharacterized protein n=1 Tax=Tetrapyrgos nigripes TaxID=182062 RepID=A0A8H5FPF9_9AGAR|nr:hypothetical protein D9758_012924 [Tetrapyrgos nigripes]
MSKESVTDGRGSAPRFAWMSFNKGDRIRFMRFNSSEIQTMKSTLSRSWSNLGIQVLPPTDQERDYYGAHEFKLRGYPWYESDNRGGVPARHLMCNIFEILYDLGWVVYAATDVIQGKDEKDTTVFRYQSPPLRNVPGLKFVNAPEEVINTASQAFSSKIQRQQWKTSETTYKIKFHGYPFSSDSDSAVLGREMAVHLLEILEQNGFTLYVSLNQTDVPHGEDNAGLGSDTWYCRKLNN